MPEKKENLEFEEEMKEPEISVEEQQLQDIHEVDDGEQIRVHSLTDPGTPLKYMVVRSKKLDKQVLIKPQYHELKETDGESVIGYLRKGDTKTIQDYGTENKLELDITGEQRRGE